MPKDLTAWLPAKANGMMFEKPDCKLQSDFFTPGPQEFSLDTSHFR